MPFTPAHPAAILPLPRLMRRYGVPSALVIGSFAPDLAYFLPLNVPRTSSHSLLGLFWFCIPIGAVAYLLFHFLLKRPLLSLLPDPLQRRAAHYASGNGLPAVHWASVAVSLFVGACTHLAWDAFTHDNAPGVVALSFLRVDLFSIGNYHVYAYRVLQHSSSALGLLALSLWILAWFRTTNPAVSITDLTDGERHIVYVSLLVVPALSGLIAALWHLSLPLTMREVEIAVGESVVTIFSTFGLVLILFAIWWHLVPGRRS